MKGRISHSRHSRFRAILIFLACTATAALTLSAALLFHLFFSDAFTKSEILTVPDLSGAILPNHLPAETSGFQIVRIDRYDDTPAGTVLGQSPAAGSKRKYVPKKRYVTLTLYVSKGPETEVIPSVIGSHIDTAVCELLSLGFSCKRIERFDNAPAGEVISQSHVAGTVLQKGETVILTVSKGEKYRKVRVPTLSGLSPVEARSLAEAIGLRIGKVSYSETAAEGEQVLAQLPLPGTRVPIGTEISLTLSGKALKDTEEISPETSEAAPPEIQDTSETEQGKHAKEGRDRLQKDKKRDPSRDPAETEGPVLDHILDRFFERFLPKTPEI